jgi:hypothetical protein
MPLGRASAWPAARVSALPAGVSYPVGTLPGMDEPSPQVIWRLGQPWRDLTPEVEALPAVTAVSLHGTARIMVPAGWQVRIPLEGGHVMWRDLVRHPMSTMSITPCGVSTNDSMGGWHQTSRLILVLAGEHPRWLRTEVGQAVFTTVRARGWSVDGHPETRCEARYCVRAADTSAHATDEWS